jgi:hypothetical protein
MYKIGHTAMLPLVEPWHENAQIKVQQANPTGQKGKTDAKNCSSPRKMKHGQGINADEMAQDNDSRNNEAKKRKNYDNDNVFT